MMGLYISIYETPNKEQAFFLSFYKLMNYKKRTQELYALYNIYYTGLIPQTVEPLALV